MVLTTAEESNPFETSRIVVQWVMPINNDEIKIRNALKISIFD